MSKSNSLIFQEANTREDLLSSHETLRRFAEIIDTDREKFKTLFKISTLKKEKAVCKLIDSLFLTLAADIVIVLNYVGQILESSTVQDFDDLLHLTQDKIATSGSKANRRKRS